MFYNWTMGGSRWVTTGSYQTNYQMDFSQAYISLTLSVKCVPGLEVKVVNGTDATFTPQVTYSAQ